MSEIRAEATISAGGTIQLRRTAVPVRPGRGPGRLGSLEMTILDTHIWIWLIEGDP